MVRGRPLDRATRMECDSNVVADVCRLSMGEPRNGKATRPAIAVRPCSANTVYFFGLDSSLISIGLPSPVTLNESFVCVGLL